MCTSQAPKNFPAPMASGTMNANAPNTYPTLPASGAAATGVQPVGSVGGQPAQGQSGLPAGYTTLQQILAQIMGGAQ